MLVALTLGTALTPVAAPQADAVADGAIVLVEPHVPALGATEPVTVRPVTAADGRDYYLFSVRVRERDESGAWSYRALDPTATFLRARNLTTDASSTPLWGGAAHAFAFAGDATRVLVAMPAAARPRDAAVVEALALGRAGHFNLLKRGAPVDVADALDAAPTLLDFNATSAGPYRYSVGVEVTRNGTGYDVTVTPLSPLVERSTLRSTNGTASLVLDASRPARLTFNGTFPGVVATTDGTRFSLPGKGTMGGPVARILLCKTSAPCLKSVASVITRENTTADGRASYSPVGEALSHHWSFGDGATGADALVRHDWAAGGSYEVTHTVTDESGRSATAVLPLTVLNQAPTGSVRVTPDPADRVSATTLRASATDVDGYVTRYSWFVDGAPVSGHTGGPVLVLAPGALALGSHSARVLMRDDRGATGAASVRFDVVNLPPVAAAVADRAHVRPGVEVGFRDESRDSDGAVVARSWSFGDGATSDAAAPRHAYAAEGVFVPSLVVRDADGGEAALLLPPVVVDGTPPSLDVTRPGPAASGWHTTPVRFTVRSTDDRDRAPSVRASVDGEAIPVVSGAFTVTRQGDREVVVTATDLAGNRVEHVERVRLDSERPSVLFAAPEAFSGGVQRIVVNASDGTSGVVRIEFYVDQRLVKSVSGPGPLVYDWDTRGAVVGRHALHARAFDAAGHASYLSQSAVTFNLPFGLSVPPLP